MDNEPEIKGKIWNMKDGEIIGIKIDDKVFVLKNKDESKFDVDIIASPIKNILKNNGQAKFCTRCKTVKSILDFSKDKKTKDGLQNWCNSCHAEYERLKRLKQKQTKFCPHCKTVKSILDFNKNQGWCKECKKKYMAKYNSLRNISISNGTKPDAIPVIASDTRDKKTMSHWYDFRIKKQKG